MNSTIPSSVGFLQNIFIEQWQWNESEDLMARFRQTCILTLSPLLKYWRQKLSYKAALKITTKICSQGSYKMAAFFLLFSIMVPPVMISCQNGESSCLLLWIIFSRHSREFLRKSENISVARANQLTSGSSDTCLRFHWKFLRLSRFFARFSDLLLDFWDSSDTFSDLKIIFATFEILILRWFFIRFLFYIYLISFVRF